MSEEKQNRCKHRVRDSIEFAFGFLRLCCSLLNFRVSLCILQAQNPFPVFWPNLDWPKETKGENDIGTHTSFTDTITNKLYVDTIINSVHIFVLKKNCQLFVTLLRILKFIKSGISFEVVIERTEWVHI